MKIIQAMKLVKANKEKIVELTARIKANSAHLSIEKPLYEDQGAKVREWTQACLDISRDNVELLTRIAKTNMATMVTIELVPSKVATKSIAEWVWRRREYAACDQLIWQAQGDRGLKEQRVQTSPDNVTEITIVRYYDPSIRDAALDALRREPSLIDGQLEVTNAVTDLLK